MPETQMILLCRCAGSQVIPEPAVREVARRLTKSGTPFHAVDDLCGMAARQSPSLRQLTQAGPPRIAACFPRAVRWLFAAAGAELPADAVIANLRTESAEQAVEKLLGHEKPKSCTREIIAADRSRPTDSEFRIPNSEIDGWLPWFPVIDYSRCNQCRQCLNFCLFGVYEVSADRKVAVKRPANCKTNCPACARVCPQAAIIFPKYKSAPINGDEVTAESLRMEDAGNEENLAGLVDKDLYAALRERARRAKEQYTAARERMKAVAERQAESDKAGPKPLLSLGVAGLIPPGVMQVLDAARQAAGRPAPALPDQSSKKAEKPSTAGTGLTDQRNPQSTSNP